MFADFVFNGLVALFFGVACAGELSDYWQARPYLRFSDDNRAHLRRLLSPAAAGAMCLWAVYRMPF